MNTLIAELATLVLEVITTGKGSVTLTTQTYSPSVKVSVGSNAYTVAASLTIGGSISVTKD